MVGISKQSELGAYLFSFRNFIMGLPVNSSCSRKTTRPHPLGSAKSKSGWLPGYNPFCLDRAGGRQREAQPKHVEFVESLNLVLNQRVQQVAKATIRLSNVLGLSEPSYSCKCLETAGNQLLCRKTESLNLGAIKCHCRMQPTIDGIIESASTVSSALAHTLSRI